MSQKQKGCNAEREIIHLFWNTSEWTACRVAGSGSIKYPAPDILAANIYRKLAIECKTSKSKYQYLEKREITELLEFCKKTNAEPWIAIKFSRSDWRFIQIQDLEETEKHYTATRELLEKKGILFNTLRNL
ncbi:Holliday junction resolvase [Candidatus Woesearchaeota archaeon]|nr:Holliday junction resolvase [Candidatus Woesearchaeota archaeon]